ncbi:MAG: PD-(D/E)XK nuclease family protein [Kiritimatiellales bacterium]
MNTGALIVFPTELAKRQFECRRVCETGALDASRHFTRRKLEQLCIRAARRTGILHGKIPGDAELGFLYEEAAAGVSFAPQNPLAGISAGARRKILKKTVETFSGFAGDEQHIIAWLLAHAPEHKLHGAGQLLTAWQKLCREKNIADRFTVNTALLQLAESGELPPEMNAAQADSNVCPTPNSGIIFRAVRWLNPFEERFVAALKNRLGANRVQVVSVLPASHAEAAEERLCASVHSELMRGAEEQWTPWLEDFADALETDDSHLLEAESRERVALFTAAHPYGEIEDAARRIAREIESGRAPDHIALILRNLGPYTDIIPDVFRRFNIPCFFRRGTPAPAHPRVKALLALLAFPQKPARDRLCDLLTMPGIEWQDLSAETRRNLVERLHKNEPPFLRRLPPEAAGFFESRRGVPVAFPLKKLIAQHSLELPEEVLTLIDEIADFEKALPAPEFLSLFEELLENVTLKDETATESGVWIINPMDAAGLKFESVYIAGMDDQSFPQIPAADALLNGAERKALRRFLEERKIFCPRLALPETKAALIQEEILFLTAMGTAKNFLTLSFTRADADGKERAAGEFFERMRAVTGIKTPELGESFHTILPPELCRAEDEVRQTNASLKKADAAPSPRPLCTEKRDENVASMIQKWMVSNPEFSATALESLAYNRFVFFLEHILKIRPERLHEDATDRMDRGSILHNILKEIYSAIAGQSGVYANKVDATPSSRSDGEGNATKASRLLSWQLSKTKMATSIPLAVFDPAHSDEMLHLAHEIMRDEFRRAENSGRHLLGHPAVWENEKQKIRRIIENYIQLDIDTAQDENRFPALFEMKFGSTAGMPVTLQSGDQKIGLKGKIDRIDLIFNSGGELERLLVIDYKGKSHTAKPSQLEQEIALNLDCQLPVYTFAVQQKFSGACNTPELNAKIQAVYHLQERDNKKMKNQFTENRISMLPDISEQFCAKLFENIALIRSGDLSTEPLIQRYEDYSHICRTEASEPKDMLKSSDN